MTVDYQKVWQTMNDLEMVTTKICSAREIIDAAIDRIQEHQNDKAEIMMTAAYEFLEYYLIEFDEKFKDAWKATVGDLRDGDRYYSGWDYTATGEKFPRYTEEEMAAMCDKAASDAEKEKCREYNLREAEYYNKRAELDLRKDKVKKWILSVEQGNVDGVTDYYIEFPDDLLEAANLREGDTVEWVDQGDGSYLLKKVGKKEMTYDEMIAAGWSMTDDGFWIKEHVNGELEVQ